MAKTKQQRLGKTSGTAPPICIVNAPFLREWPPGSYAAMSWHKGVFKKPYNHCQALKGDSMAMFKGQKNAAAAIFVYKDGPTNDVLWNDDLKDVTKDDPIHVELLTQKDEFLNNLNAWNSKQEFISEENAVGDNTYTPAMLVIHAHMGETGIAPVTSDPERIVSWDDLTKCIIKPVSLVWLFGCQSDVSKTYWLEKSEILMTCPTEEKFRTLVSEFKDEVTMRKIVYFGQMLKRLREKIPTLSYFTRQGHDWMNSFEK